MTFKWRQGMHCQVKEKLMGMLWQWEAPELKPQSLRYLRHSQFYKICLNKYGSRSAVALDQFPQHQQEYFSSVSVELQAISINISSFMFGFKQPPAHYQISPSQIPAVGSREEFNSVLDKHIENQISLHLPALCQKYNKQKLGELKQQAEVLLAHSPQAEEDFQKDFETYQRLLLEGMNLHCLRQVIDEIQETTKTILSFRTQLAQKAVGIHGTNVLRLLYKFSLTHPETQYNGLQNQ